LESGTAKTKKNLPDHNLRIKKQRRRKRFCREEVGDRYKRKRRKDGKKKVKGEKPGRRKNNV